MHYYYHHHQKLLSSSSLSLAPCLIFPILKSALKQQMESKTINELNYRYYLWLRTPKNLFWYWGAASSGPWGAGMLRTIVTGLKATATIDWTLWVLRNVTTLAFNYDKFHWMSKKENHVYQEPVLLIYTMKQNLKWSYQSKSIKQYTSSKTAL